MIDITPLNWFIILINIHLFRHQQKKKGFPMKKRNFLVLLFMMLLVSTTSASSSETYDLVFATQDFPPFSYEIGTYVAGPAADIIRAVCKDNHLDCNIYSKEWSQAQMDVKKGKAHAMFLIGWNKNRSSWLHFSYPIMHTEYGVFVRKSDPMDYTSQNQLKGYHIGVYGPSNTSQSLLKIKKTIKNLRVDFSPDSTTCFNKLSRGDVDAVYSNKAVGQSLVNRHKMNNIRYAGRDKSLDYYFGFNQKYTSKAIVDKFNASFKKFYETGVIQEVLSMYGIQPSVIK